MNLLVPKSLPRCTVEKSKHLIQLRNVVQEFSDAGFTQIVIEKQDVKKGLLTKNFVISKITIKGQLQFTKGDWFEPDSLVRIIYQNIISE